MSRGGKLAMEKCCQAGRVSPHLGHDDDGEVVQHGPCHHGDDVGVLAQQARVALREHRHGHRPVDDERVGNANEHHDLWGATGGLRSHAGQCSIGPDGALKGKPGPFGGG